MDELTGNCLHSWKRDRTRFLPLSPKGTAPFRARRAPICWSAGKDGFSELSAAETWNIRRFCMRRSWCRRRKVNTENTISEPERGRGLAWSAAQSEGVLLFYEWSARRSRKSGAGTCGAGAVPQLLDFFALDGTGIRVLEKEAWEMLPAAQEKAGHCRILELDGKTYYAEEFCYDGKVYLFGGGHLAQELVPVLHHLDFCCIVLDDREEYVDKALFPDAGQTMLVDFTKLDEILSIRKNDYLVIVTRGHRCDADAEAFALRTGASYIGVVGSRRKTKYVREKLEAQGFTGEQLDSVYAPIGIEIGSETPAEIAISIAAQLIQIRSAKTGKRKGAHPALHT